MLKDIRIKITNKSEIDLIIDHALIIGYPVELNNDKFYQKADYLMLDPNQIMRWCSWEVYICSLNYEEMSVSEFLNYQGGM